MTTEPTESEDFYCACSDDEKYNAAQNPDPTAWEPAPSQIIELYEKVANGEALQLEWRCPGRRELSPEAVKSEKMEEQEAENTPNENEEKPPTEFDFDDMGFDSNPVATPRRTPGASRTPRSVQKRVARLDKILDDITRNKKLNRSKVISQKSPLGTPVARPPPKATAAVVDPVADSSKAAAPIVPAASGEKGEVAPENKPETAKTVEPKGEEAMDESGPAPSPPPPSLQTES
ncbi:hypothetical protein CAPTEDRAFT_220871 [Capitella teleta]|uniref:PAXIP1-associated glutamate-rich protein 1 n=1 Tax=Capitella teleta TaxID=283909 RepID=R7V6Z1_CAPTE|nr:hypothetical protein CAPTEDRAFT_220871 [Capitella teleta]|eukprot:ELU14197.1 hypothetical protein CAPTEDRAFT_220871 [Capitella teleta]